MGATIIEKIIGGHAGREVGPGDTVDVAIDARVARDFGGANVVKNIVDHGLVVEDAGRTYFIGIKGSTDFHRMRLPTARDLRRMQERLYGALNDGVNTFTGMGSWMRNLAVFR